MSIWVQRLLSQLKPAPSYATTRVEAETVKPPVLGCFTQGVIKSLVEEPDKWSRDNYGLRCSSPNLLLMEGTHYASSTMHMFIPDIDLTWDEKVALAQAVDRRSQILKDRANALVIEHFSKLGCPSS